MLQLATEIQHQGEYVYGRSLIQNELLMVSKIQKVKELSFHAGE
jgi:hypothetical protein